MTKELTAKELIEIVKITTPSLAKCSDAAKDKKNVKEIDLLLACLDAEKAIKKIEKLLKDRK